jgi:hypothetical protein
MAIGIPFPRNKFDNKLIINDLQYKTVLHGENWQNRLCV